MRFFKRLWSSIVLSFRYLKVMPQLIIGAWKISRLPQPVVSIFGGSRLNHSCKPVRQAEDLAGRLVAAEISVITGGGPGIMEAANCGAFHKSDKNKNSIQEPHEIHTMGVGVRGVTFPEKLNPCVKDYVLTDFFPIRKYLLIYYSYAYVVFPGGFGTLDEFMEIMTLLQTKKLAYAPIILIGSDYWHHLIEWIEDAVKAGLIPKNHADYITVTDSVEKAAHILIKFCAKCRKKMQ